MVEKVNIATIAFDPTTNTLKRDDHREDDGFNNITMTPITAPSLAKNWKTVATNVSNFKIEYLIQKDTDSENSEFVRNPRIGEWGETNAATAPYCGNQLGFPNLHQVSVTLDTTQGTNTKMIALGSLSTNTGGSGGSGGGASYETAANFIPRTGTLSAPTGGTPGACGAPCLNGGGW